MEKIDSITDEILEEIIDTKEKNIKITYNQKIDSIDLMAIESVRKIENPFIMIDVKAVMEDLDICKNVAYKLFQREDFPSINIGKNNKVMLIAYMMWKMRKRV